MARPINPGFAAEADREFRNVRLGTAIGAGRSPLREAVDIPGASLATGQKANQPGKVLH